MDMLVVVALLTAQLATAADAPAQPASTGDVAIVVNGERLTAAELRYLTGPGDPRVGPDSSMAASIVRAVDTILAAQYGRRLGYSMTDEQFASLVQNLRRQYQIQSDGQFQAALLRNGLNESELRQNAERQLIARRVSLNATQSRIDVDALRTRANLVWFDDSLKGLYERALRRP
jgi:hypothetical protein